MNLTALLTAIQDKGYSADTVAQQTNALNAAYRRILGMHRWPFLEKQADLVGATGVGISTVSLVGITDLRDNGVDAVRLYEQDNPAAKLDLTYLEPQQFRSLQHSYPDNGEPQYWTMIDNQLNLWPAPIKVYGVVIDYVKTVPALSAGGDTPVFDPAYHDVLVWGAIKDMTFRERDYSGSAWAAQMYGQQLGEMERSYGVRQKQNSRQVQRSSFWRQVGRGSWDDISG